MRPTSQIVQKLWKYCHVLCDDGMSYGDYVEQLTYLLFLKIPDERTKGCRVERRWRRVSRDSSNHNTIS